MSRIPLLAAALLLAGPALARPPELRPDPKAPIPTILRQGESAAVRVLYVDPDGDRPQSARLVVEGGGQRRMEADLRNTGIEYRRGIPLTWTLGPLPPGRYGLAFEAASIDGRARYPREGTLPLVVESLLTRWLLLAVGLFLALAVVPGMVFMGARRAADPAGAARTGLAVGVIAAYLWFLWLFFSILTVPVLVVAGVVSAGAFIWLAGRKKFG